MPLPSLLPSLPPSLTSLSVASIMLGHCHRHHHADSFNKVVHIVESKGEDQGGREEGVPAGRVRRRRGSTLRL